jgi:hypothetical protein
MANPVSPVVPGHNFTEVDFAENQPEYLPLPAIVNPDGNVITRWQLSEEERQRVAETGELWLLTLTFKQPLQPMFLTGLSPTVEGEQEHEKRITLK